MEYQIKFSEEFEKTMLKLIKRNPELFRQIQKKLSELVEYPEHYKPLRNILAGFHRIHFGSYVLIYTIEGEVIKIMKLEHHDDAY